MTEQAFISRRVVTPEGIRPAALIVEGGRIRAIVPPDQLPRGAEVRDFGNAAILPGLVDTHVHINDPGRAEWEGFEFGSRAAAAGGYTMLVDMPLNSLPGTTDSNAAEAKRAAARGRCLTDWAIWGGVVADNQGQIEPLAEAGVNGFKSFLVDPGIDGFTMITEPQLRKALPHVARTGLPLMVHAELSGPIDAAKAVLKAEGANWKRYETYLRSRPDEAELSAIRMLLNLCREFKFRLHIVHLATSQGLALIRAAKAEGLPVTVETCPHYLHKDAETIADGATLCKCAPPIRGRKNREELWEGLRAGIIDFVVTDHSPCLPEMKKLDEGNFGTAWGGIVSLSVALPVVWTEARRRGFSLSDIARWMSEGPAKLAGCEDRKGRLAPGHDADFVVFDADEEFTVRADRLYQRHPVSAYMGERLRGGVKATYLRGRQIFAGGKFAEEAAGIEQRRRPVATLSGVA
jgi:allantoinase